MPGRIYPNLRNDDFEQLTRLEALDADVVANVLSGLGVSEEGDKESVEDDYLVPEGLEDEDGDGDGEGDAEGKVDALEEIVSRNTKQTKTAMQKIASADQVAFGSGTVKMPSAEYIRLAKEAGADDQVERALEIRASIRNSMLSKIAKVEEGAKVDEAFEQAKAKKASKPNKQTKKTAKKASKTTKQTKVASTDNDELIRTKVAQRLQAIGVPEVIAKNYVEHGLKTASKRDDFLSKIASLDLDEDTKKDLAISFYKQAELTDADARRIEDYWINELGYQDVEWVRDLTKKEAE